MSGLRLPLAAEVKIETIQGDLSGLWAVQGAVKAKNGFGGPRTYSWKASLVLENAMEKRWKPVIVVIGNEVVQMDETAAKRWGLRQPTVSKEPSAAGSVAANNVNEAATAPGYLALRNDPIGRTSIPPIVKLRAAVEQKVFKHFGRPVTFENTPNINILESGTTWTITGNFEVFGDPRTAYSAILRKKGEDFEVTCLLINDVVVFSVYQESGVDPNAVAREMARNESATRAMKQAKTVTPSPKRTFEPRVWKSADGAFSVEARFVSLNGRKVKLKRNEDNKLIEIELENLSGVDRDYVESLTR